MFKIIFLHQNHALRYDVKKYSTDGEPTAHACWLTKTTDTHSDYIILYVTNHVNIYLYNV
jgi:hypothetical protein